MTDTFSKLAGDLITSSIWSEDDDTRIIWITMLALKDAEGFVSASLSGLANSARKTIEQTKAALKKLEGPDPDSRTSDHEGRRVIKVEGGWMVINHFRYRDKDRAQKRKEKRNAYMKDYMADVRAQEANESLTHVNGTLTSVSVSVSDIDKEGESEGKKQASRYSQAFLTFWGVYPKKKKKGDAWKAWKQQKPDIDECLKALEWQKAQKDWLKDGGQYVPYPATWIRASSWEDEPDRPIGVSPPPQTGFQAAMDKINDNHLSSGDTPLQCFLKQKAVHEKFNVPVPVELLGNIKAEREKVATKGEA